MIASVNTKINAQLQELQDKFAKEGKDISSYLEKLLQERNLDYTDYLHIDTLLSLQKTRTDQPDEMVFIVYHQVVELFFRLIIWELEQLTAVPKEGTTVSGESFVEKINRVNRYVEVLVYSFEIILQGLDKDQFQQFRYALFPASGFQSFQYRLIEFYLTDLKNLVSVRSRGELSQASNDHQFMYDRIYWKRGMLNPRTGEKSPTLKDFENRYDSHLFEHALKYETNNIWQVFQRFYFSDPQLNQIIDALRQLDQLFNIQWQGLHYRVAMKYLTTNQNTTLHSTGNTHWRKYLHPKFQKIIFFPDLWQEQELAKWGTQD